MNHYDVVRVPQHSIEDEWPEGFRILGEGADYWGDRACGLACLKMILSCRGIETPSLVDMLELGVRIGAYCDRGWIHRGLLNIAGYYGAKGGLHAEIDLGALGSMLSSEGPVIASVTYSFPEDGRKGGHLIVVTSVSGEPPDTVHIQDPSGLGAELKEIASRRFMSSFSGRVISFE